MVDPIDDASDTGILYTGTETLFVTPMEPIGHPLDIQWYLDGLLIPGATGTSLDLSTLSLRSRQAMGHRQLFPEHGILLNQQIQYLRMRHHYLSRAQLPGRCSSQ